MNLCIKKGLSFILLVFLGTSNVNAQERQLIPAEFFTGKWAGELKGYVYGTDGTTINFSIDYSGVQVHGEAILRPFGLIGVGGFFVGSKDLPFQHIVEGNRIFYENIFGMQLIFDVGENPSKTDLILASLFVPELLDSHVDLNNSVISVNHIRPDEGFAVKGEIHKIGVARKTFPKDIKPDEPIKTDKKTQLEITLPSKDVIKVAPNTQVVIRAENLIEIVKGKVHGFIKNLQPKPQIKTLTSIAGIRGTEYEINVEDDGTTTLIVFDGEVEFSDRENKKTVILRKNQKSVVNPGTLPTDPEEIDPAKIFNWWK